MQLAPPDVMITNYSMLNVALMRDDEAAIFDETRRWLERSDENVFTLVVDEMHLYRGTSGSEVAYLVRRLRRRLGLDAGPDQFRVIATTASIDWDRSFGPRVRHRVLRQAASPTSRPCAGIAPSLRDSPLPRDVVAASWRSKAHSTRRPSDVRAAVEKPFRQSGLEATSRPGSGSSQYPVAARTRRVRSTS